MFSMINYQHKNEHHHTLFDLCYLRFLGANTSLTLNVSPKCQENDAVPLFPPHAVAQNYYLPKHASGGKKTRHCITEYS